MNVIILAAGLGSRLKDLTTEKGKALVELNGRPLIDYAIEFTNHPEVEKRIIVGGFTYPLLEKHIKSLKPPKTILLENKDYKKGNIFTLRTAIDYLNDDTLIMNVDHVYNPVIFTILKNNIKGITAIVDSDRNLHDDDMKVKLNDWGNITSISKQLSDFDKGYIGMTMISKELIDTYKSSIDKVIDKYGEKTNIETILQYLADNNQNARTLDVSMFKWLEIDTQEELEKAKEAVDAMPERFPYFN